jgi:hypothetical protein
MSKLSAGPDSAQCDLAAVGDQDPLHRSAPNSLFKAQRLPQM